MRKNRHDPSQFLKAMHSRGEDDRRGECPAAFQVGLHADLFSHSVARRLVFPPSAFHLFILQVDRKKQCKSQFKKMSKMVVAGLFFLAKALGEDLY